MSRSSSHKAPDTPSSSEFPTQSIPQPVEQGFAKGEDGTALYYSVYGEGRPLLLCYGLTCRREHWHYQLSHFAKTHQVILFDYRGHHASSVPLNDQNITIRWCARDVRAILDHLKLQEAVLFGHSMGVPVVVEAMALLGNKIKGAVLVCGAITNPFQHMFYTNRMVQVYKLYSRLHWLAPDAAEQLWRRLTTQTWFNYFLASRLGFNPSQAQEQDVRGYIEGVNSTAWPVFFSLISDYSRYDGMPTLAKIKAPVLVIGGQRDYLTPIGVIEQMAKGFAKADLESIPHGSHNAHMDFPEDVNDLISEFLHGIKYK